MTVGTIQRDDDRAPERKLISAMWLELRPCLGRFRAEICKGALKPRQIGEIAQALATLIAADGFADAEELSLARAVLPDACAHCGAPPAAQRRSTIRASAKDAEPHVESQLEADSVEDVGADANRRIEVVHVATGRVVRGSTAPLASSIDAWLAANPGWRTRADVDASAARNKAANAVVAPASSCGLPPSAAAEAQLPQSSQATDAGATQQARKRSLSEREDGAVVSKADAARDANSGAPPALASSLASSPCKRAAAVGTVEALEEGAAAPPATFKCRNAGRSGGTGIFEAHLLHSDTVGRVRGARGGLDYAKALGARLLGECVEVWWEADASWYAGTISKLDRASGCFTIEYDDGDIESGIALPDRSVSFRALGPKPTGPPPRDVAHHVEIERLSAKLVRDRTAHPHIFRTGDSPTTHQFIAQLEESRGSSQICLVGRFATFDEAESELERARQQQRSKSPASNAKGGSRAKPADRP